jgi:hypothetical protein
MLPITQRAHLAARHSLEIGGEPAGPVTLSYNTTMTSKPLTFECGTGMSKAFYHWIRDACDGRPSALPGALVAEDVDHREVSRRVFQNALITEIQMPACDGASKDAAKMTIKFEPGATHVVSPTAEPTPKLGLPASSQKQWSPANFRLQIAGLEDACTHVSKIDAITIKQKAGGPSNLTVTLPIANARLFYNWYEKGVTGAVSPQGGRLEYLTSDRNGALFTLTFNHVMVVQMIADRLGSGFQDHGMVKAEMHCKNITFDASPAAWQ